QRADLPLVRVGRAHERHPDRHRAGEGQPASHDADDERRRVVDADRAAGDWPMTANALAESSAPRRRSGNPVPSLRSNDRVTNAATPSNVRVCWRYSTKSGYETDRVPE